MLSNAEVWTAATAFLGTVVLVLNYLRERGPSKTVNERLDALESDVEQLKSWRSS